MTFHLDFKYLGTLIRNDIMTYILYLFLDETTKNIWTSSEKNSLDNNENRIKIWRETEVHTYTILF